MKLQKAILTLNSGQMASADESFLSGIDSRAFFIVTLAFLIALLSVPLEKPEQLIWFAAYPIILSPLAGLKYSRIFLNSLYILPLLIIIGIFNPFYDHRIAFNISTLAISMGWITFFSIIIRGLLAMQALLILVKISGFIQICNSLAKLGVPKVLTVQLLMLYRYIGVLMEEVMTMRRAGISRGYGRKSFPLKMWSSFTGSLLLRSVDRARRIFMAMEARGFNGIIITGNPEKWTLSDSMFILLWVALFLVLRFVDIPALFSQF